MTIDRRSLIMSGALAAGATLLGAPALAQRRGKSFPRGFRWGAATSGGQNEGNNVNSDLWLLENSKPSVFSEPSGDATNSFELWRTDLDLVKSIGLNTFRFSLEWARIEPEEGRFSIAMLDHYKAIIEECRARGIAPVVTYCHYSSPRWLAARGGWLYPQAPALFARFCERATRHLGAGIDHAATLNEPNIMGVLGVVLPPQAAFGIAAMLDSAAKTLGTDRLAAINGAKTADVPVMSKILLAAHRAGRQAIKSVRPDLPVGMTLAMFDDEAVGATTQRDSARARLYGMWLDAAREDDFVGVQNYERVLWGSQGRLPPPQGASLTSSGGEIYAASLANACRYAYSQAKVPILVTEHGVATKDDQVRAKLIREALPELLRAMDEGVPVKGYIHWTLIDNWEFVSGYEGQHGLASLDRTTFKRTLRSSAVVLGAIARRNAL